MSGKRDKKLRKIYRKEVQDYLMDGGLWEIVELLIKPKPKYVPKWLWMWGASIFIKTQEDTKNAGENISDKGSK